jgi:magnesium chelatase subunit D
MPQGILTSGPLPFTAILGMDDAKRALVCAAACPGVRGVLIRGGCGSGKTVLVRALAGMLPGTKAVTVPQNVTEEQLFGCLDLDSALKDGTMQMQESLIQRASGGFLCIDDVNLFDRRVMTSLMNAVASGEVLVEREGLSASYGCDVTVVATVNTSEPRIDSKLADCFDICVTVPGCRDAVGREAVMNINRRAGEDPDAIAALYLEQDGEVARRIARATEDLGSVVLPGSVLRVIVESCSELGSQGYRGELSTIRVAKTLAALDSRDEVTSADATEAMRLCMQHRRSGRPRRKKADEEQVKFFSGTHMKRFIHDERRAEEAADPGAGEAEAAAAVRPMSAEAEAAVLEVGKTFETVDIMDQESGASTLGGNRMKRAFMEDGGRTGRYVRSRMTEEKNPDLALDATVRAAAPCQAARGCGPGSPLRIEKQDIREKVRETRPSCTFLFMIDNSGSLVIRSRMSAVKAAVLSMLTDHYVKRDRVGLMTFNEKEVGMLLTPTRSVDCVSKLLTDLQTGERTPLSRALVYSEGYMRGYVHGHKSERCYVVLMTDASANISMDEGADPFDEAIGIASRISVPGVEWIVVDTSSKRNRTDKALLLAEALRAQYYRLDDLRSSAV